MGFFNRKMLGILKPIPFEKTTYCLTCAPENCHQECGDPSVDTISFPPPPTIETSVKYHMPSYFVMMLCVLGAVFVFICYMFTLKRYRSNSRTRRNLDENETREDNLTIDENLGPVVDHPIWYIRTVGLPQEIIDSISVFKYKKDEFLVEGTDCSICLTEFEEDESLRLLPKCSHAFHVPCIDTWLRSHKNCPLCRAPIVSNVDSIPQVTDVVEVSNTNGQVSSDELENLEEGNLETTRGVENLEEMMEIPRLVDERKKGVRVFSDLNDHRVKVDMELQPARRSVSMDCSAAQAIHLSLGNIEACSSSNDQLGSKRKSLDIVSKRGNRNSSLYKAMKSSSFGRSLQKVPITMKRSFSTSGKCSLPTTSKSQDLRETM